MGFELTKIVTNSTPTDVDKIYYTCDNEFAAAKETTKNTIEVFGESVIVNVKDNNATVRDLQSRDILAKYIGGVSGYNDILGSPMEDAFIRENPDDFQANGSVTRNNNEYINYTFDSNTSDGNISMPTLQKGKNGEEFYVIGDKKFDKYGQPYND